MILIIDNYDSFTHNISQVISVKYPSVKIVRNNKVSVAEIIKLQPKAIIISPGPGRPEDAGECINIIQHFSGKIPLLGICLGHQAIAKAFKATIVQSSEIMHGKVSTIKHNKGTIYHGLPQNMIVGRYHSLCIEKKSLPKCLKIESLTQDNIIMGLRHIEHPTYGVQFHPESILTIDGYKLINNFIEIIDKEYIC